MSGGQHYARFNISWRLTPADGSDTELGFCPNIRAIILILKSESS